ncbi:MAG: cytochrome c1 [Sinobacterium sp.]|nr:cytochrome c1 [Sinobacterium sp.]
MKKGFISAFAVVVMMFSQLSLASGGGVALMDFTPNLKDKAGLQKGAQTYVNYCLGCHSMKYQRYNRLAKDLDIPADLATEYLIFDDKKIGQHMTTPVNVKLQKKWFGAAPPDLTLVARARGEQWLYTYLKTFYLDDSRPNGVNNLVFKDVGMPNVLGGLQGDQQCKPAWAATPDLISGSFIEDLTKPCQRTEVVDSGTLTDAEFDELIQNLVSFMVYSAEPVKIHDRSFLGMDLNQREVIGVYGLLFLCVFGVFAVLLNREYWKDIH